MWPAAHSPYVVLSDEAFPSSQADLTIGTSYQETLTTFPLGNQIITGIFLDIDLRSPNGTTQSLECSLVDRIGLAIRQGGGGSVSVDPNGPPALTDLDIFTVNVSASAGNPGLSAALKQELERDVAAVAALPDTGPYAPSVGPLLRSTSLGMTRMFGDVFLRLSDEHTERSVGGVLSATYSLCLFNAQDQAFCTSVLQDLKERVESFASLITTGVGAGLFTGSSGSHCSTPDLPFFPKGRSGSQVFATHSTKPADQCTLRQSTTNTHSTPGSDATVCCT